ncbi:glycosyltransferase [Candidatus Fermentibacteria bacterium]|nr:glycosyltransferase [Candidatus Fermentibacteria bacterium]
MGPIVGYFPVYGPILAREEQAGLRLMDARASLSRYGARVIQAHGFACTPIHLGVDGGRFRPALPAIRRTLRRDLGWHGRFVVAYVARNRWNKQQPKLLEAARILRERGMEDIIFYLHCVPTLGSSHWVPGMGALSQEFDLLSLRSRLCLEDVVIFPDDLSDQSVGIPEERLIQRLQAADCAAHVAHGEGFGLPLIECMACGLPVLYTTDGRVMSEVVGKAGVGVPAHRELTDAFMNRFGDVTPPQWAEAIAALRRSMERPLLRRALRGRARRRSVRFSWDDTAEKLECVLRGALRKGAVWRIG